MRDVALEAAIVDAEEVAGLLRDRIESMERSCSPLLKWAGGKASLLPELVKRLPPTFNRYYEPFAGGAALFFHLAPKDAVLSDLNADLMTTYQAVARNPENVIRRLKEMEKKHSSRAYSDHGGYYYFMRTGWNVHRSLWPKEQVAAAMLYLNRTSYNGLWRVNKSGDFNVPQGTSKRICDPQRILACSKVLANPTIRCGSYQTTTDDARAGDFAYLDPPYVPASTTSDFSGYTAGGFGEKEHRELAAVADMLRYRGVFVMLSNADVPLVRRLYKGWRIDRVKAKRSINSKGDGRGKVGEVIITSGYLPKRSRR